MAEVHSPAKGRWEGHELDHPPPSVSNDNLTDYMDSVPCFANNNGHASATTTCSTYMAHSGYNGGEANGNGNAHTCRLPQRQPPQHEVNVDQVLVELQRERQKNAELMGKLSSLEARLLQHQNSSHEHQDDSALAEKKSLKNQKRLRNGEKIGEHDELDCKKVLQDVQLRSERHKQIAGSAISHDNIASADSRASLDNIVNWMGRDELQLLDTDILKNEPMHKDEADESNYTDDDSENANYEDDDEEEDDGYDDSKAINCGGVIVVGQREGDEYGTDVLYNKCDAPDDGQSSTAKLEVKDDVDRRIQVIPDSQVEDPREKRSREIKKKRETMKYKGYDKAICNEKIPNYETSLSKAPGVFSSIKKAPKLAFCPKEVRRIMDSGVLALKNAQSHTMRKIIIFASLGIRHGCEDIYELDFSHFTIMRKGEPYISSTDPGEHVIYEQPGVRRKIFFPNRQNPVLCPVRILREEKEMRPSDPSCPSCLFLCIKYGGRTRNLPQNEYVRQRMGRNKLKSFGPLMCQMALLVHIRTGSFFFKALGITLLFMAGFTDDVVRRETKYCNLDLLQKYYRSDEDAEGEELFHSYPMFYPLQTVLSTPSAPAKCALSTGKLSGKRQPPVLVSKPSTSEVLLHALPASVRSTSSSHFSISDIHNFQPGTRRTVHGAPSHIQTMHIPATLGMMASISAPPGHLSALRPYAIYPYAVQHPANSYLPSPPWHHVNSYFPNHFPNSAYAFSAFQPSSQFIQHPSQKYYSYNTFTNFSTSVKSTAKKADETEESESDSETSSDEAEKSNRANNPEDESY